MHADNRNPPDASTAFAGMRPLAFLIAQIARLSQWRPRLLLTIGVVGPAILVLGCAPAHAQEHQNALQQEIAVVEQQVDSIESEALATIPSLVPGSPERLPRLGKLLFFDKELSVNRNEACAFSHAADRFPGRDREPEQGCSRAARLGQDTLQSAQAAKRRLCRVLAAFVLSRQAGGG
jgi:hypothetical protein